MIFTKIISVLLSAIMSFGALTFPGVQNVPDMFTTLLFGMPVTQNAVNDEYRKSIDYSTLQFFDSTSAFAKNKLVLILDPSAGFFEKYSLFAKEGLKALGWCTPVDLYIVSDYFASAADMIAECERLEEYDEILMAAPLTVSEMSDCLTPDDPFDPDYFNSWNENDPEGPRWWLEAIDARQAWDYLPLINKTTVGIVDSGVNTEHPDLAGLISFPNSKQQKRNVPGDHGTHVPGIVSAIQNNGEGICGVFPGAPIVYQDWMPDEGQKWNDEISLVFSLVNEVKAGAKVINYSVGKSSSVAEDASSLSDRTMRIDGYIYTYAVAAMLSRGYEFLILEAAGNGNSGGSRLDAVNAGLFAAVHSGYIFTGLHRVSKDDIINHVMLVGAAKNDYYGKYTQADFSNVGPYVEIAAPGVRVYSCAADGGYRYMGGTSMAAPVVTAVAAMVFGANPSLTAKEVKEILVSATDCVAKANKTAGYMGSYELNDLPMVNAKLAVEKALILKNPGMKRIEGTCPGAENGTAVYAGKQYTVLPDGSYSFLAGADEGGEISFLDSDGNPVTPDSGENGQDEGPDTPQEGGDTGPIDDTVTEPVTDPE